MAALGSLSATTDVSVAGHTHAGQAGDGQGGGGETQITDFWSRVGAAPELGAQITMVPGKWAIGGQVLIRPFFSENPANWQVVETRIVVTDTAGVAITYGGRSFGHIAGHAAQGGYAAIWLSQQVFTWTSGNRSCRLDVRTPIDVYAALSVNPAYTYMTAWRLDH